MRARGDGRYVANVGPEWVLALVPQGGVVAAVAARAMEAELGIEPSVDGQELRSIHGVFVSPVPQGELEVEVQVLRHGRSLSQAQATVKAPGAQAGFTALAVFGGPRPGVTFTELVPPPVPDPDDCPSFRDPPPPGSGWDPMEPMPLWAHVLEGRPAMGHAPWDPSPRGPAEIATWYRFERQPIDADGMLDALSSLVLVDIMPGAVFEKVGPGPERLFGPSADLTVHLFDRATPGWMLAHASAHEAGDGYASVQMALWDPRPATGPRLVAYATQVMFFTPFG